MKKSVSVLLIFLAMQINSHAVEFVTYEKAKDSYVCIASDATGFFYDTTTQQWKSTRFRVENSKYLLQKMGKEGWKWGRFGTDAKTFCPNNNKRHASIGFIECKTIDGSFDLNLNTLRYVHAETSGFTDNGTDNKFKPNIEIGTCSPM